MSIKDTHHILLVSGFLLILSISVGCSTSSWLSWVPFLKKGPPHKAKMKELVDKEVIIIDGQEYVKVLNPNSSKVTGEPKYLYVPVDDYLANMNAYAASPPRKEMAKEEGVPIGKSPDVTPEVNPSPTSRPGTSTTFLKKKVVVAYFDQRTTGSDEAIGDWIAERFMREVDQRSQRVLFVDYQMVKSFLEKRGVDPKDLETPKVLGLLNEVFGVNALVVGNLAGPYIFASRTTTETEGTSTAIVRIEMKLIDTLSGRLVKDFSSHNPILATKEQGSFSEEKAKIKAIDLTLSDLSRSLSRELDRVDWSCRIVRVDGEEIYLNAGRLTGLKVGDILDVFPPSQSAGQATPKGRIQISGFLGVDASVGRSVDGSRPEMTDILRPGSRGGT
jgi:hypothetical protein